MQELNLLEIIVDFGGINSNCENSTWNSFDCI